MCCPCFSKPRPPLEHSGSTITVKNPVLKAIPKPAPPPIDTGLHASRPLNGLRVGGPIDTPAVSEAFIKEFGGK